MIQRSRCSIFTEIRFAESKHLLENLSPKTWPKSSPNFYLRLFYGITVSTPDGCVHLATNCEKIFIASKKKVFTKHHKKIFKKRKWKSRSYSWPWRMEWIMESQEHPRWVSYTLGTREFQITLEYFISRHGHKRIFLDLGFFNWFRFSLGGVLV